MYQDFPNWNNTQLDAFTAVLKEFAQYDNTAGVFIGNEVITQSMLNSSVCRKYKLIPLQVMGQQQHPTSRLLFETSRRTEKRTISEESQLATRPPI